MGAVLSADFDDSHAAVAALPTASTGTGSAVHIRLYVGHAARLFDEVSESSFN